MLQTRRNFLNLVRQRTPPTEDCWLHVNRTAMACRFEVTLPATEETGVVVATEALDEIDRLEAQLTVFRPGSEVSFINRVAATEEVTVQPALFDLLALCKQLYAETEGAFDITSGPLSRCWGFLKREGRLPGENEIALARSVVGSDKLILDSEHKTVRYRQSGVEINLGSIGKGFALDQVGARLRARIPTALLNAGASSMRAVGSGKGGEGWEVGLRHPRSKFRRLGVLRLHDCALSTSGSEEQFFTVAGRRFGHIIDPRTGWPADGVTSVTVVTSSAAVSDALATAFFVGGRKLAESYVATHKDVLVIMLESEAPSPLVLGSHPGCAGLRDF
ncbi:MAG TPA: FAD:protein FMN transferase [Pyrinomonadaceae bacterium]|nr:FAD:protein FMN transferase [Pyrinomonadaceae bacterium]